VPDGTARLSHWNLCTAVHRRSAAGTASNASTVEITLHARR